MPNSKNIYYTSNSFQSKYPENSRSSFVNKIDEQEFHYIDKQNVKIGLKEITFQNSYNTFKTKYGSPNMIIVEDKYGQIVTPHFDIVHPGPESPQINIKSGFNYYILSDQSPPYGIRNMLTPHSFTDVQISCFFEYANKDLEGVVWKGVFRFVVHNIYFHDSPLDTNNELIDYLNHIFHNIEFDVPPKPPQRVELFRIERAERTLFDVDKNGVATFWDKRHMGLDIFLSNELCEILGFSEQSLVRDTNESLQGLLFSNFVKKKHENIRREPDWVFSALYKPEELHKFTTDTNVQDILDFKWGNAHRYFRISQDGNVRDSFYNKVIASNIIDLEHSKPVLLGLRSSLSKPDIFKNCKYDTQQEFINVKDMDSGVQIFEIQHPTLCHTSIEKISNAEFELIDIDTGRRPNFSVGSPTFIHFHVNDLPTMTTRFNLFLDSSDNLSKAYFPTNNPADFCIQLPERLEFNKTWEIALKNIFIGNDLFNIYSRSCWISFDIITEKTFDANADTRIFLEDGLFKTTKELCEHIQSIFDQRGFKLKISRSRAKRVKILCLEEKKRDRGSYKYTMKMSPALANILGFVRTIDHDFVIPFEIKKTCTATYSPMLDLLIPRNFMILCDVVSESVFGSKSIKILKLLSANFDPAKDIINFSFHQEEFVGMAIKEFTSVRIQIVDTTGDLIKSKQKYPTRCQIQFMKSL